MTPQPNAIDYADPAHPTVELPDGSRVDLHAYRQAAVERAHELRRAAADAFWRCILRSLRVQRIAARPRRAAAAGL